MAFRRPLPQPVKFYSQNFNCEISNNSGLSHMFYNYASQLAVCLDWDQYRENIFVKRTVWFSNGIPFWAKWWPFCPKPLEIQSNWSPFCSDLQWFCFTMVGTIAIAIAKLTILIPNHWKSKLQTFGFPMFGIQAPTVGAFTVLIEN